MSFEVYLHNVRLYVVQHGDGDKWLCQPNGAPILYSDKLEVPEKLDGNPKLREVILNGYADVREHLQGQD